MKYVGRYSLKNGKYGPYFYDDFNDSDMSLDDVLKALNDGALCTKIAGFVYQINEALKEVTDLRKDDE